MRLLVNTRGSSGSGKSTIVNQMMSMDLEHSVIDIGESIKTCVTVFPRYEFVTLGKYSLERKCGGMDTIKSFELIKKALLYAHEQYPEYDILMEGLLASHILSSYVNLFKEYEEYRKVIVLSFVTPAEVCIQRVYERNGGKAFNEETVRKDLKTVTKNVPRFKESGFTSISVDTSKVSRDQMLPKFLRMCEKYREE